MDREPYCRSLSDSAAGGRSPGQAGGLPGGAAGGVPALPQALSRPAGSHNPPWTVQSKRPGPTMELEDGRGGNKARLLAQHQGDAGGDPRTCPGRWLLGPGIDDGGFRPKSLRVALPRPREGARYLTSVPRRSLVCETKLM